MTSTVPHVAASSYPKYPGECPHNLPLFAYSRVAITDERIDFAIIRCRNRLLPAGQISKDKILPRGTAARRARFGSEVATMSSSSVVIELTPDQLCRRVQPENLSFATTADVAPLTTTIGQPRALDAIEFGLETRTRGFNLFVAGTHGSGRESTVREAIATVAAGRPTPPDWVYVHNFIDPDRPVAISFPAGQGRAFADAVHALLQSLQKEIPRALESEEVQRRRDAIIEEVSVLRSVALAALQRFAAAREFSLEMTPTGIISFALIDGKPIVGEEFAKLPEEKRLSIEQRGAEVQAEVATALRQFRQIDKATAERLKQLELDVVAFATGHFFETLREAYSTNKIALAFLEQLQADIPDHLHDFQPPAPSSSTASGTPDMQTLQRNEHLGRYQVNVLVDNSQTRGAPVIFERNPTFANLVGRVDYRAVFGAMVTDFREIKPGALHRANGGFLALRVVDILSNALAWETLKRALFSQAIAIESIAEQLSMLPTARLRPEPIPLDTKVILIGSPAHYQLLYRFDEDFAELFGVRADFAPDMIWSDQHINDYAAFISRQVREHGLVHFDPAAVALVVEYGARSRDDQRRLTTYFLDIANLVVEASHWATKSGHDPVMASDVEKAIAKRVYRSNLVEERFHDLIADRTIAIETEGERIAQVNGLSIVSLGDYMFGQPSRISARVAVGRGTIQSIEREIELSGPIHSKGVLILSGYLQGQYGYDQPLAMSATITFEQSYNEVEGDSASSTELYALLSALSELPLKQGIAVTGSVNQHGEIQAVGGVTRKIEGFFEVCKVRGLTGDQGVIIPATNVNQLMLVEDIVQAVREGRFHIWPVHHVDEGISLLTGVEAGQRRADGSYPDGSVHQLVVKRLARFFEQARVAAGGNGLALDGRKKPTAKTKRRSEARPV